MFLSAATTGDMAMIKRLVAAGVSVNTCDTYGELAILLAARLNQPSVVRRLLELGADLDLRGPTGHTLVHNRCSWR
jgi:uncharacterized protein